MVAEVPIAPVLEQYSGLGPIRSVHFLANAGGFSGSLLWRLEREAGDLCLRRWPENFAAERLEFIHGVLSKVGRANLSYIPAPILTSTGKSFLSHDGRFWELAPWMPGKADFQTNPTQLRLTNLMQSVARLHQVAQKLYPRCLETSPTLLSRRDQTQRLMAGDVDQLAAAVNRQSNQPLQARGERLLAHFRRRAPAAAERLSEQQWIKPMPLFPVIRDLWHDHILFSGDEVTGIVDFGAMRVDSVACDLSRLLGSLVGNDREAWEFARHAYNSIRPLSADEWQLTQALDEANVILAGLNWLDWICVEGRTFENYEAIYARLDEMLARLDGKCNLSPA